MTDRWWDHAEDVHPAPKPAASASNWWDEAEPVASPAKTPTVPSAAVQPIGQAHDGDTFRLSDGRNARLYGVDAFELNQTGRRGDGSTVQLGQQARTALLPYAQPGAALRFIGAETYGRPVAALTNSGVDAGTALLHGGLALATPEYLRGDPQRFQDYTQEERLARLNRRGAFAGSFQTPKSYRQGNPDPWNAPQAGTEGNSEAVFWDDPTPFQGLKPEVEKGYIGIWQDLSSKPEDLIAYAKANGFQVDPDTVRKQYEARNRDQKAGGEVQYMPTPRVLTDLGDGRTGAALRGFADPINMLDEAGAVVDSLLPGGERENVWGSDRRFGDIYANNLEQNRAILANDDAKHPWFRFGGQLASGLVTPGASVEGVGLAAARKVILNGGGRYAAEQAARRAVLNRMALAGGIEGALAGAGQGETTRDRATGAAIGGPVGATLGVGLGVLAPKAAQLVGKPFSKLAGSEGERVAGDFVDGGLDTARARMSNDAQGAARSVSEALPVEPRPPDRIELSGSVDRPRDVVDVGASRRGAQIADDVPLDTSAPVRPAAPPRTMAEVQAEIDAWAAQRGARQAADGQYPDVMLHGSPRADIQEFAPYGRGGYGLFGAGTYLTDTAEIAASYTGKGLSKAQRDAAAERTLYAVKQAVRKPLDMDAPADRAQWEGAAKRVLGDWADTYFDDLPKGATNERYWREVEDILTGDQVTASEGQETMDALVRSLGHDGITHIGGGRVDKDGPRHRVVIALDPEQTEIVDRLSVGSLMNPPAPRSPSWIDANAGARSTRVRDRLYMTAAPERPTMVGPQVEPGAPRSRDYLDMGQRPRPLTADATDGERLAAADRLASRDVLPLPANTVDGVDEAARIEAGRYAPVKARDEANTLDRRTLPNANTGTPIPKRGPADLVTWLRSQGGVKAQGGELAHSGIDNAPRKGIDFAEGEKRFGPLVSNEGMSYDEAAQRAWEAGYFPDHVERPTVNEFLDALEATHSGRNRSFLSEDLPEVDRFNAARQQRYDVERARDQGAPLSEDRSAPVDMADLDANAAPVTAYVEWGENAPNLAGNIRLDKLDSPQAIKRALTQTEQVTGGFDAARRGRITHAETESLANDLGMTADDLLKRRKGQAFNAEEALAARQILARSATDLVNMAKRISRTDNAGDELEASFREAWLRHAAIQEQVAGMTAEAGRLLQQFRQSASASAADRVLPTLASIGGNRERIREVADRIVDLDERAGTTPAGINQFALRSLLPRWQDRAVELYINSLLSGPQTHATNILSNTLTALAQLPEHAVAAGIGAAKRVIPSARGEDRVLFSELGARAVGLISGAKEGMRAAARSMVEDNAADVAKVEGSETIPGLAGKIIRTPTRLLTAEDELFKGMARRMELHGLAVRQAEAEGLKGHEATSRAADLVLNPTDDMLSKANDYARYLTFQTPLPSASMGAGISRATQRRPLLKLIVPFVRTPMNLLKFSAERSPMAPLMESWRREIAAGGARRDLAAARMMVGTGIGAALYEMAGAGQITGGGPADPRERAMMLADGWQPYSFKIGDRYYSYSRLDPFATTIGTAADLHELSSQMDDEEHAGSAMKLSAAIINNLSSKTWLSGLSSTLEAVNDPGRYLDNLTARTVGAIAVPALSAQIARTTDPVIRDARSPIDRIRSRIPGLSNDLYPKRNVFGEEVRSEGGVGPDLLSPIWTSTDRHDQTLERMRDADVTIGLPPRTYVEGGERKRFTPGEYDLYQTIVGGAAKPRLSALIRSPSWAALGHDEKQKGVSKVMEDARKEGREILSVRRKAATPSSSAALPSIGTTNAALGSSRAKVVTAR